MAAPTLEQTRAAASGIHAMADADFARRRSAEAGDALVAFFVILARKLFSAEKENVVATRVELMLAAWFLRGEVDGLAASPPDEAKAKKAVDAVAALDGVALDARIGNEVGDSVMAFFSAFANKVTPDTDPLRRAKTVQLMVLAYLLRGDLTAKS